MRTRMMPMFKATTHRYPAVLLALVNILAFAWLYVSKGFSVQIIYAALLTLALFLIIYAIIIKANMGDKYIVLIAAMLMSFGEIMLCRINPELALKQIVWIALGGIIFFGCYVIYRNIWFWDKMWFIYFAAGLGLFIVTALYGTTVGGAKNWLSVKGFTFQPSEIIKVLFALSLACYCSGSRMKPLNRIAPKYTALFVTYSFICFLIFQREWGTMILLFAIYLAVMYVYEKDFRFLLFNLAGAVVIGLLGHKFLHHIQVRVAVWINPWSDISDTGYQVTQSLFAIISGGFFGKGLGNGHPYYIPEVHSDFIFSAICEEMGIFGGVAVILLFFLLAYRCFRICIAARDKFDKGLALGLSLTFAFQTFIIIGGVINAIPLTGITLPFVSYGGSSMLSSFASLGIMQAISRGADDYD